jgi:hypothetical protein
MNLEEKYVGPFQENKDVHIGSKEIISRQSIPAVT